MKRDARIPFSETSQKRPYLMDLVALMITVSPTLNAGGNTIRLLSVSSTATADIDWIEITGNTPSAANCSTGGSSAKASDNEQNLALDQSLSGIYPNPAKGKATITVTLDKNEQAVIRVYDAQGRLVDTIRTNSSATGGTQQIIHNLDNKKTGVYNVVIVGNKGLKSTHKLIVE